ncbi:MULTISPECIES: hypothetical protein [unclassified Carboxylicivirga]|uniref:hypothetical protein n=1 Tax=Carboxylicivirga TaxID=1628153 RepID=UPI003D3334FE
MKYLTIIFVLIALLGCSKQPTQYDIVKRNAKLYTIPQLNDPSSYEFASLKLIDSVLYRDNIEYKKQNIKWLLQSDKDMLKSAEDARNRGGLLAELTDEKQIQDYKGNIKKLEGILKDIEAKKLSLGDTINQAASYTYEYSFRAKNAMGALVLEKYIVQTKPAPSFDIINMAKNANKVLLNPNSFPGYDDIMSKYKQ